MMIEIAIKNIVQYICRLIVVTNIERKDRRACTLYSLDFLSLSSNRIYKNFGAWSSNRIWIQPFGKTGPGPNQQPGFRSVALPVGSLLLEEEAGACS